MPLPNTLTSQQLHTLKLTYKFRFITAPLLAQYKNLHSRHATYTHLEKLTNQGYLAKHTTDNTHFENTGARYYLTLQSLQLLQSELGIPASVMRSVKENDMASGVFINHHIEVMRTYLAIRDNQAKPLDIYTKVELVNCSYMPSPKPDLYVEANNMKEYLVDVLTNQPTFVIKKRIDAYIRHYESGDWETSANTDYPEIILICNDEGTAANIQASVKSKLSLAGITDLNIYVSSQIVVAADV